MGLASDVRFRSGLVLGQLLLVSCVGSGRAGRLRSPEVGTGATKTEDARQGIPEEMSLVLKIEKSDKRITRITGLLRTHHIAATVVHQGEFVEILVPLTEGVLARKTLLGDPALAATLSNTGVPTDPQVQPDAPPPPSDAPLKAGEDVQVLVELLMTDKRVDEVRSLLGQARIPVGFSCDLGICAFLVASSDLKRARSTLSVRPDLRSLLPE